MYDGEDAHQQPRKRGLPARMPTSAALEPQISSCVPVVAGVIFGFGGGIVGAIRKYA